MKSAIIHLSTYKFLKGVSENNNREWFANHKDSFLKAQNNMTDWIDQLIFEMNKHDTMVNESGKKSLYRIYNDVRFSKDKAPYNPRFAFSLSRATKYRRGGYYLHLKPGNNYLACGFFSPNPEDLKLIRQDIEWNYIKWYKILNAKNIKSNFGTLKGEIVATSPRGFDINHAAIELIRHKQFILRHNFTDKEVLSPDFIKEANKIFKSVRPFFDYMSEILTTNANGELMV